MEELIVPPTQGMRIVYETGPFDKGLATLVKESVPLWSAEDLAGLRVKLGVSHNVSTCGSWVSNGFVYMADSDTDILVVDGQHNPIVKQPADATQAHHEGKEFYVPHAAELRDRASSDVATARKSGVFLLRRSQAKADVPPEAFGDEAQTQFLLGSNAGEYGRFLADQKIKSVSFYFADADYARKQEQAFGLALWVLDLDYESYFYGSDQDLLNFNGRVGGVSLYNAREAGAPTGVSNIEQRVLTDMRHSTQSVTLDGNVYVLQQK